MEKGMSWGCASVGGIMLLFFIWIALGVPFGGLSKVVDIFGILASPILLYLSIETRGNFAGASIQFLIHFRTHLPPHLCARRKQFSETFTRKVLADPNSPLVGRRTESAAVRDNSRTKPQLRRPHTDELIRCIAPPLFSRHLKNDQ